MGAHGAALRSVVEVGAERPPKRNEVKGEYDRSVLRTEQFEKARERYKNEPRGRNTGASLLCVL